MKNLSMMVVALLLSIIGYSQEISQEKEWTSNRPDGHAPISVMGDHIHGKGGWMISYRYMHMNMEGLRNNTQDISYQSILRPNGGEYMVSPVEMPMDMHMLGMMYAVSNKLTLMSMVGYSSMKMEHITAMGGNFETSSTGFSDIKFSGLYKVAKFNRQQVHLKAGISIPTGSIDQKDITPASNPNRAILPYPMQIGSGTLDFNLGATYLWQTNIFSGGNQFNLTARTGINSREYRLGNVYNLENWVAFKALDWMSFSARVKGNYVAEIKGSNPELMPLMVPTANTENSGGFFVDGGLGLNIYLKKVTFKNLRLGMEISYPIVQDLNGIQLKCQESITTGVQYAF